MVRVAFCLGFLLVGLLIFYLVVLIVTNLAHLIPGPVGEQFRMGEETLISILGFLVPGLAIAVVVDCALGNWVSHHPREVKPYLFSLAVMIGIPLVVMCGFLLYLSQWV